MNKFKVLPLLLVVCFVLIFSSICFGAQERNIYVGDLIELKIDGNMTLEELTDKFKAFELVESVETDDGYTITLRSFEPGETTVQIGDKELKIIVKSTLDEMENDGIIDGDSKPLEAGFFMKWKYILFPLAAIFIISLVLTIWTLLKKKNAGPLTPYQQFNKTIGNLTVEQSDYLVQLNIAFKTYIEANFGFTAKGKSSTELVYEIQHLPRLNEKLEEISTWLTENDYYKFSGVVAPMAKKLELMERLTELVNNIEPLKEGEMQ